MIGQQDILNALLSIDATLKELLALSKSKRATTPAPQDDADLDTKAGDETVKFNPRDWTGQPLKGLRMSECPPEALDLLANSFDYFARKNDDTNAVDSKGNPKSRYDRQSARRARGWSARLRAGWKPKVERMVEEREIGWMSHEKEGQW